MRILCDRRALHHLEYELETLILHRMPMLHGPNHRQMLMVVDEAFMSLVLMHFQVNVDVLHACAHHGLAHPNSASLCKDLLFQSTPAFSNVTYCFAAHSTLASVHHM